MSIFKALGRRALRLWVFSVALALAVAVTAPGNSQAQETLTVEGRVVSGTSGGAALPVLSVLMLAYDAAGGLVESGQTNTAGDGAFQFGRVPLLQGGRYSLGIHHQGVFYSGNFALGELSDEVQLTVYEASQDVSLVEVTRQVLVITGVDEKNREITAAEFVLLSNRSDRAFVPDISSPASLSFLRFSLPAQAEGLDVRSDLPSGDIISIGTGFAMVSPVAPGDHSISFTFRFPYQGGRFSYRQSLPQGSDLYQVLVPDKLGPMEVSPLQPVASVDIEGSRYRAWEGRDYLPGQGVVLELTGLPRPGLLARVEQSITSGGFWKIAVPSAAGASLAIFLLLGASRGRRRAGAPLTAGASEIGGDFEGRAALVLQMAALDERFHRGQVAPEEYHSRREGLKARILTGPRGTGGDEGPALADQPKADGRHNGSAT